MPLVMRVLSLCLLLVAVPASLAQAATPAPPIFPPASVFALPPSPMRQPVKLVSEAWQLPAKAITQASGYFSHQHTTYSYYVTTFHTSTDALQDNSNDYKANDGKGVSVVQVQHPVAAGEWLEEDADVPPESGTTGVPYGSVGVGVDFRNLSMVVYANVQYHDAPAAKTKRMSEAAQLALDTLAQLYARAQAYALHAPSQHTPAPQPPAGNTRARNVAFRKLLNTVNRVTSQCRGDAMALSQDVHAALNNSSTITYEDWQRMSDDATATVSDCAGAAGQNSADYSYYYAAPLHHDKRIARAMNDEDTAMHLYAAVGVYPYLEYSNTIRPDSTQPGYVKLDAKHARHFLAAMGGAVAMDQRGISELRQVAGDWGVAWN